jgi:hypothetical protein
MCPDPEEKTLDNGVRLRLCRDQTLRTSDHLNLKGDLLEVSEPPEHNPVHVWLFPNAIEKSKAERAFKKQVPLAVPADDDQQGATLALQKNLSEEDENKYIRYRKLFGDWEWLV